METRQAALGNTAVGPRAQQKEEENQHLASAGSLIGHQNALKSSHWTQDPPASLTSGSLNNRQKKTACLTLKGQRAIAVKIY